MPLWSGSGTNLPRFLLPSWCPSGHQKSFSVSVTGTSTFPFLAAQLNADRAEWVTLPLLCCCCCCCCVVAVVVITAFCCRCRRQTPRGYGCPRHSNADNRACLFSSVSGYTQCLGDAGYSQCTSRDLDANTRNTLDSLAALEQSPFCSGTDETSGCMNFRLCGWKRSGLRELHCRRGCRHRQSRRSRLPQEHGRLDSTRRSTFFLNQLWNRRFPGSCGIYLLS